MGRLDFNDLDVTRPSRKSRELNLAALICWLACCFLLVSETVIGQTTDDQSLAKAPDFNRQVRPILAAKCFACHGPDEEAREADLRLDDPDAAMESGVLSPGKLDESELLNRVLADDDSQMPPRESGESLSEEEINVLKKWIQNGAKYEQHWAFVAPKKVAPLSEDELPEKLRDWASNPIDHFVLKKLMDLKLAPSDKADRYTLVRRLYLDLIGIPPTPQQADAFVRSNDPKAYEHLVDSLLDSPAYGEKWARQWLDLARYADTNGYEKDRPRSIWPYRDWVIRAINDDMPFDQFTIEQLAGDMLPDATNAQRVATGFHRNTMLNEEGGIDPLEYRYYAMVDRVATTGTIWMGLTTGCAQCHTHKYDPITHTDFFRLMALLNNADEPDLALENPGLTKSRQAVMKKIDAANSTLKERFLDLVQVENGLTPEQALQQKAAQWINDQKKAASHWQLIKPTSLSTNLPKLSVLDDQSIFASGDFTKRDVYQLEFELANEQELSAIRLEVLPDDRLPAGGPGNAYYEGRKGDFFLSELKAHVDGKPVEFASASTTFGKISIGNGTADGKNVYDNEGSTGWSTSGREGQRNVLVLNLKKLLRGKKLKVEMVFERHFVASLGRFRLAITGDRNPKANPLPDEIERKISVFRVNQPISNPLISQFLLSTPVLKKEQSELVRLRQQLPKAPMTMVMREREADNPRNTFRHHRGEYLSPREKVEPQLPSLFPPLPDGMKPNRLSFAKWLVSGDNPLAARVTVNRDWQSFFGRGLVTSAGDFGTQSTPPTHPELLDWLAVTFVENGWSRKKLHRLIVTSSTYRAKSNAPGAYDLDPENEWLVRGPRFRVDAEVVRDIMLAASGKLSNKMYGPSVYPPQPASVTAIAYGNTRWPISKGEDRYRRSLYTFSKRTAPFAAYQTFNSPTGENCVARRNRSNTPLQALTVLNDEMFVELARALASKSIEEHQTVDQRATFVFRRLLTRPPETPELTRVKAFYQQQFNRLSNGELQASQIAGDKKASLELAAWTLVARALMSLDEVITKQ